MSIIKYNTKWPFDLNNMSREMNKNYAMVWERYTCQFLMRKMHFIFYKTSTHRFISYLQLGIVKIRGNKLINNSKHEKIVAIRKLI